MPRRKSGCEGGGAQIFPKEKLRSEQTYGRAVGMTEYFVPKLVSIIYCCPYFFFEKKTSCDMYGLLTEEQNSLSLSPRLPETIFSGCQK